MPFDNLSHPVSFQDVSITSPFWTNLIEATRNGSLPAMYEQMKKTGRWDCLKLKWKPGDPQKPHQFWDSDVAKWLEGACYALTLQPDPSTTRLVEEAVDMIRGAQQEDGYINTYYTVVEPGKRWTNIAYSHEMYDAGHLLEAALAHRTYSGSNRLLDPLLKYIRHIGSIFGPENEKKKGYPGHEELELALIKAYETTEDNHLLSLARYFIEERGTRRPEGHYYDIEAAARGDPPRPGPGRGPPYSYHQADKRIQEMTAIEGHSVRAMYWLTGAAGVARLTRDDSLLEVIERLWTSTTERKMYVTGGLGAVPEWEGFGPDYFLPNETGYLETCAAIGLVIFAHQMMQINSRVMEYADVMELALYNAVLVGMSLDGRSFFYDNPLATVEKYHSRSDWFEVSCCPPNVVRLLNSLGKFIYSVGEDDTIFINLYISSTASLTLSDGESVEVTQESDGPWEGSAKFFIKLPSQILKRQIKVCLRKPIGSENFLVSAKGFHLTNNNIIELSSAQTEFAVSFDYNPEIVRPHPLSLDNRGHVAVSRGPFIYCAESVDNEHIEDLRAIRLPKEAEFEEHVDETRFAQWGYKPVILTTKVQVVDTSGSDEKLASTEVPLTLIPYFMWANRGKSDLRVWLPVASEGEEI